MHWTQISWGDYAQDAILNGRRLRYIDYGSGSPVLLVHGIGCSWTHWLEQLPALGAEHRVIAVDLPGFGESDPLPHGHTLTATSDALRELLDQLQLDRVVVVGHSLGGLVGWLLVRDNPQRVSGLVLVGAATVKLSWLQNKLIVASFSLTGMLLRTRTLGRALTTRPRLRPLLLSGMVAKPLALDPRLAAAVTNCFHAPPGWSDALAAANPALGQLDPTEIKVPTKLFWGTRDPYFSVRAARQLKAQLADADLVEYPAVGHSPMLERPREFTAGLSQFIAQLQGVGDTTAAS